MWRATQFCASANLQCAQLKKKKKKKNSTNQPCNVHDELRWFLTCDLRIALGSVYHREKLYAQSLFLFTDGFM